jgi:histidinol-phosphate aminotransferase
MLDPIRLIRPHIQNMPPYEPIVPFEVLSQQLNRPINQIVKLDANENPYGPLPAVSQALAAMPFTHIYPDPESRALRSAISAYHGVPVENILAGAGADELIDLILRLVIEPGDRIINCPPTFGMYAFDADLNAARVIPVGRHADYSLDIEAIEQAVNAYSPKLIFLASPNNPDGSLVPRAQIERLLELPVLVVLDEAYIEFAAPGSSLLTEAPTRQNLVVLRTFSKWAGLAGLRVGFGAFPSALMPHLWKIKQPYMVSVAASTAAILSLQYSDQLTEIGHKIIAERQRLSDKLGKLGWLQPYPSQANYVLCRVVGRDALDLKRLLASQGILVRYFNKPGLQDHIRISVGKPQQSDLLIQVLKQME